MHHQLLYCILITLALPGPAASECDNKKTGLYQRFFDLSNYGGFRNVENLYISCKQGVYTAKLQCHGDQPISKSQIGAQGNTQHQIVSYSYSTEVAITIDGNDVSLSIPKEAKPICGVSSFNGYFRHFSDSDEILPDDAGVCDRFNKVRQEDL